MPLSDPLSWNIDIDRFLNLLIPPPPWGWLPYPIARLFGYRKTPPQALGNVLVACWAFLGIFCGVSLVEGVSSHIPSFRDHGAPLIVASFGAAAVLEFCAIESPLSQPRCAVLGQILSSVVGVGIAKLFAMSPRAEDLRWLSGSLACAAATAVMILTKTVHPPAGATALLAAVDESVRALGWFLVPVMMLGAGLMLAAALIVNNIQRRFPVYWWTPEDLTRRRRPSPDVESTSSGAGAAEGKRSLEDPGRTEDGRLILIRRGLLLVPGDVDLSREEKQLLDSLSRRL
ncbi:hypothetical protein VTN02DRAFT_5678 [Thermoascus thermophilus]